MSVKAKFQIENTKTIEATLAITMSLDEWRQLSDQLNKTAPLNYPSNQIIYFIGEMLLKVSYPKEKE